MAQCWNKERAQRRFLSHVAKSDEPKGCWLWIGSRCGENASYGGSSYKGKYSLAHRVSYQLFVGRIPDGMQILHSCDNGLCVNPDHLSPGTQKQNLTDMMSRGRRVYAPSIGACNSNARLKEDQVVAILLACPSDRQRLAREFGVTINMVDKIRSGCNWAHVRPDIQRVHSPKSFAPGGGNPNAKLTDAQADEIFKSSDPAEAVALRYKVSPATIANIRNGKAWRHATKANSAER